MAEDKQISNMEADEDKEHVGRALVQLGEEPVGFFAGLTTALIVGKCARHESFCRPRGLRTCVQCKT